MKLVLTFCLLATGMTLAGFVQAESASMYMHIKKGGRHAHRPQAVVAEQADAGEQPLNTILPPNSRIVQGDDTKDEFHILAEGEQEPVKPIEVSLRQHQMAVKTQLKRVDTKGSMWAISKPAHVDAILSQIAHKATLSEQHMNVASAHKKTEAKSLFQAKKNGNVVDIEVALDKLFAEVDANNQFKPKKVIKLAVKKHAAKGHLSQPVKKLAVKKHAGQRILSQKAFAKPAKSIAKKSTQKKIKPVQHKKKRQHLAMIHKSHMATRRHTLIHVNA